MTRARSRGMTLLEIIVSIAILGMMSILIYGAFDSTSRNKKGEAMRADRAREAREALLRISRELQESFISMHNPQLPALATRVTAFIGSSSTPFDRLDFSAFAHIRVDKDAKESDQCEVGYFAARDTESDNEKWDLVRREQTPEDLDPKRGGVVNVLVDDIEALDFKYLDPQTGMWAETWDSSLPNAQYGRLPLEVRVQLTVKGVPGAPSAVYTTKVSMPMQQPLKFGIPNPSGP